MPWLPGNADNGQGMGYALQIPERWTEDLECVNSFLGTFENAAEVGPRGIGEYSLIRVAC